MEKHGGDDRGSRRWERIGALFDAVYNLPPDQRADALMRDGDDPAIRAEVASLLAEEESVPQIIDSAAFRALGDTTLKTGPYCKRSSGGSPAATRGCRAQPPWPATSWAPWRELLS